MRINKEKIWGKCRRSQVKLCDKFINPSNRKKGRHFDSTNDKQRKNKSITYNIHENENSEKETVINLICEKAGYDLTSNF